MKMTTKFKDESIALYFDMSEGEYMDGAESYMGLCLCCGEEHSGIEPDARFYRCESCKENAVYGIEELLFMGRVRINGEIIEEVKEEKSDLKEFQAKLKAHKIIK